MYFVRFCGLAAEAAPKRLRRQSPLARARAERGTTALAWLSLLSHIICSNGGALLIHVSLDDALQMLRRKHIMDAKAIANGTLAALEAGYYTSSDGATVAIRDALAACVSNTRYYEPDDLDAIYHQVIAQPGSSATTFAVVNETTLQASARLVASQRYQRIGVLNFASARNPGGGFLRGARAQEESLARSSGLYYSLRQYPQFYEYHRALDTTLYSDRMIYSPACPVLRDDAGDWLAQPYTVDFIT